MDLDEAILTLRKNKLDMEHEALLQDRNVIAITEAGLPIDRNILDLSLNLSLQQREKG